MAVPIRRPLQHGIAMHVVVTERGCTLPAKTTLLPRWTDRDIAAQRTTSTPVWLERMLWLAPTRGLQIGVVRAIGAVAAAERLERGAGTRTTASLFNEILVWVGPRYLT